MTVKIRKVIILSLLMGLLMSVIPMLTPHSYADAYVSSEMTDVPDLLKAVKDGNRYPEDEDIRDIVLSYWRAIEGSKGRYWNGLDEDSEYWTQSGTSFSQKKAADALLDLTGSGKVENLRLTVTDVPSTRADDYEDGLNRLKSGFTNSFKGAGCLNSYDASDSGFAAYMLYMIYGTNNVKDYEKFDEYNEETGEPQPGDYVRCAYDDGIGRVEEHSYVIYQIVGRRAYIIEADVPYGTGRINKCTRAVEDIKTDVKHEPIERPEDYELWARDKQKEYDRIHKNDNYDGYILRIKPKQSYTVEFIANRGKGEMDSVEMLSTGKYKLNENSYTRDGFIFTGWNTKADGSGKSFSNMEEVSKLAKTGETVKLYAQWKANEAHVLSEENYIKNCLYYPTHIEVQVTSPTGATLMSMPCSQEENPNSEKGFELMSGKNVTATQLCYSYSGEYWYKIEDELGNTGFISAKDAKLVGKAKETILFDKTELGELQTQGEAIRLPGKIKSEYNVILNTVRASICSTELSSDPQQVHVKDGASSAEESGIHETKFRLRDSTLDKRLLFARLPAGDCLYVLDVEYMVYYSPDGKTLATQYYTTTKTEKFKEIATYTIEYDPNAHDVSGTMSTSTHRTDVTKKLNRNRFTRPGFYLESWNDSPDGTGKAYANEQMVVNLLDESGAVFTLYGQWAPSEYNISFNANGGSGKMESIHTVYDQVVTLPKNTFERTDYIFQGWCESRDGSGKIYEDGSQVEQLTKKNGATVVLYAIWKDNPRRVITYDANGGENAPAEVVCQIGDYIKITGEEPTRTGYTFQGWSTKKNTSTASYMADMDFYVKDHTTFYAVWKANSYTVRFNPNGGMGSMSELSFRYDQARKLRKNTFTRKSYTFIGWSEDITSTEPVYTDEQEVMNLITENDGIVMLYAVWSKNPIYTISYDQNGGSDGTIPSQTGEENDVLTLYYRKLVRTGYDFLGWNEDKDATEAAYAPGGSYTVKNHDQILYGIWKAHTYTVQFNSNDGKGTMPVMNMTYDVERALLKNQMYKPGSVFAGWNTKYNGSGDAYADEEVVKNLTDKNNYKINLYAQWQANPVYTVTFDANGGSGAPVRQTIYAKDFTLTEDLPRRVYKTKPVGSEAGSVEYDLVGWSENKDAVTASYVPGGNYTTNNNLELFAVWKQNFYTLELIAGSIGDNDVNAESGTVYSYAIRNDGDYTPKKISELGWVLPEKKDFEGESQLELKGWYTERNGQGVQVTPDTLMDQSYGPLYPYWAEPEVLTAAKKPAAMAAAPTPAMSFIESGEVEIRIPAVWGTFENAAESLKPGCDVTVEWRLAADKSSVEGRTAQYETNYEAAITLTAQDGYLFKNNNTIPVTVNGLNVEAKVLSSAQAEILFAYRTESEKIEGGSAAADEAAPAPAGVRERLPGTAQQSEPEASGSVVYGKKTIRGNEVTTEQELRAAIAGRASGIVITKDMNISENLAIPAIYNDDGTSYGTDVFIAADVTIDDDVLVENYGCLHLTASGSLTLMPRATLYLDEPTVNTPIQMSLEGGQLWGRSDHIVNYGRITIDADSYMRNDFYSLSNFIGEKDLSVTISLYPSDVISFVNASTQFKKVTVKVIGQETWELKDDFTIPENCQLSFSNVSKLILDKGVTLTNFGSLLLTYGYPDAVLSVAQGAEFINYGYLDSFESVIYE